MDRLVKWSSDWKPLWSVGRHSPDADHETGSTAMPRGLVGATHGCIVWADASDEEIVRPTVWTEDGLYVDELLRVPSDGLPKDVYGRDNVFEFPLGNLGTDPVTGDVLYYAVSTGGGSPIYRIRGWEGWNRQSGIISLPSQAANVAKRDGTGLKAEYFNTPDCSGDPVVTRTDSMVHFHWLKGRDALPKGVNASGFSCRWTGRIEAPTTDRYRFVLETMTPWVGEDDGGWGTHGIPVWTKLWIGGRLIMDTAADLVQKTTYAFPQSNMGIYGEALLGAGESYDLRLECSYASNAVAKLCWDTPALDRRVIRPEFLHPTSGPKHDVQVPAEARPRLIADFGFEETAGVILRSHAGGDNFGRLTGNARRVPGKTGRAIEFEAKGEFAPSLFAIDEELRLPDSNYTVAFWFKTTARDARLCEAKRYSKYNNIWSDHVVSLAGGKVLFTLQGDDALETKTVLNDGQWHHVVTTVGSGGQRLHVDGKLIATGKLAKRTKTSNRLGLDMGPGAGNAVVAMDELKVIGSSLTSDEITSLAK
jgi:hypothetical protein